MRLQYVIFLLVLALMNTISLPAQTIKRNAEGQKLIKRISSDLLQIDGSVDPGSFNDTYEMTYFPNGQLKSITFSCREQGGRFAERILIEADTFNIVFLKNGKRNPNQSAKVNYYRTRKKGISYPTIRTITRVTREKDPQCDYIHRFCNVFFHNRYRSLKVEMIGSYDNVEEMLSSIQDNEPKWLFTHDCKRSFGGVLPNASLENAGFKREICWFEDQNGYIYIHDDTTEKLRQEQDGNLLSYPAEPDSRYLGDVFTDQINDTNLNLQFFFEIGMPELMSEWIPVRSKNLIKYENAERFNKEIRYKKYWEYEYDSAGNLVGATVIRSDLLLKAKYKIKIEYVIE